MFFKWCSVGKGIVSRDLKRVNEFDDRARRFSQTLLHECLSPRQTSAPHAIGLKHVRETPMQVAIGLSVHQSTRSEKLINYLHDHGYSVPYS